MELDGKTWVLQLVREDDSDDGPYQKVIATFVGADWEVNKKAEDFLSDYKPVKIYFGGYREVYPKFLFNVTLGR